MPHTELYLRVLTYSRTYVNQQWPASAETQHEAYEFHEHLVPRGHRSRYANERTRSKGTGGKGLPLPVWVAENAGHVARAVTVQTLPEALRYVWQGYLSSGKPLP